MIKSSKSYVKLVNFLIKLFWSFNKTSDEKLIHCKLNQYIYKNTFTHSQTDKIRGLLFDGFHIPTIANGVSVGTVKHNRAT